MPYQYISELLDLSETNIINIEIEDDHAVIKINVRKFIADVNTDTENIINRLCVQI